MNFKIVVFTFFASLFILGLLIYKDYGLSWDEPISRYNGVVAYNYAFEKDKSLFNYSQRYYGTAFEMPLYMIERVLNLSDPQEIIFMRHLMTFLLFFAGTIAFYKLCKLIFRNDKIALLGALFLVVNPRTFADSFYNSKDLVFMSAFTIAVYFGLRFLKESTYLNAFLLGVASSFATDVRIIGPLVHLFVIAYFAFDYFSKKTLPWKQILTYIVISGVFTFLFWPIFWPNPVGNLINAIKFMGGFTIFVDDVLYLGKFIQATQMPWHYLPVWIAISTPIVYIALFLTGLFKIISRPYKFDWLFLTWFFLPIVLALIIRPSLYDGWRQFYFTFPAMVLISLTGFNYLWQKGPVFRSALGIFVFIGMVSTGLFIIRNHPYQNVYFNRLIGGIEGAEGKFDLDYWGLSFRQGLEYIAKEDKRVSIPVFLAYGISAELEFLPPEYRRFVRTQDASKAEYILSNFRWQENDPPFPEVYSVKVDGVRILSVVKVRK